MTLFLQCLAFSALFAGSLAGDIDCGDNSGPSCSNAWVHVNCGTGEACCHDDFNGWCCPKGFKCQGSYSDPGGNEHCMTPTSISSSCLCDQTDYEIEAMDPVGEATVDQSWNSNLTACCAYGTENCGWSTTITRQNSQTVSWSDAAEVGYSMSWNVEAGPDIKLGSIGFEVKDTFTYGQTTSTSYTQSYTNACTCTYPNCKGPWDYLEYKLELVTSSQPVSIKATKCGVTKTLSGTVSTVQWMGGSRCAIQQGLQKCPNQFRLLRGSVSAPPTLV